MNGTIDYSLNLRAHAAELAPHHYAGHATDRRARRPEAAEPGAIGSALLHALDAIDYGVMLVDAEARLRHANKSALGHLRGGAALRLDEGRIGPRADRQVEGFRRAVAAARTGRRSMLSLDAPGSAGPLSVAFVPLAIGTVDTDRASVLLLLGKHAPCEDLSVEFFAQAHQLTRAESVVLRGLCSGLEPQEIARLTGVAISTVRTQISSVRAKTQASSIRELVRIVALLPPMAAVPFRAA